jgi:hypothetical protein
MDTRYHIGAWLKRGAWVLGAIAALYSGGAAAQLALPGVRLPLIAPVIGNAQRTLDTTVLPSARQAAAVTLIARNRQLLEADPNGEPIVRSQIVGFDLGDAAVARISAAGFSIVSRRTLAALGTPLIVFAPPRGMDTARALRQLRTLQPGATFDYNHIYTQSGAFEAATGAAAAAPASADGVRVGLIDGGVEREHPAFKDTHVTTWGCNGELIPSSHGTAVASLLVGHAAAFHGAAPGAQLYAADVYCGAPTGGSIDAIAGALAWLGANQVPVINVSLVGPDNAILRQVVRAMIARGHIIVAAVGNDGPSAPPLYPAAYPDVVGVTAVDAKRRVLIEAERGQQVAFAAPGADMLAAACPSRFANVRGTSFAAPIVAGLLAPRLSAPDPARARQVVAQLAQEAVALGRGRNTTYGAGLVGEALRMPPDIMPVSGPALN